MDLKILLLTFILSVQILHAQNEFFKTEKIEQRKHYATALVQAQIDSSYTYKRYDHSKRVLRKETQIDTSYFVGFRVLEKEADYNLLTDFTDTTKKLLQLTSGKTYFSAEGCNDNREWVYEKRLLTGLQEWKVKKETDLLNNENWNLEDLEDKTWEIKRFIVAAPCDPQTINTPEYHTNVIIVHPSRTLSEKESKLFMENTSDYVVYEQEYNYTFIRSEKSYYVRQNEYKIKEPAKKTLLEVYPKAYIKKNKKAIENKLIKEKIIKASTENSFEEIKRGIIKFQQKENLPIGQFDLETIKALLN